jgi:seryl-tRNA synthetase
MHDLRDVRERPEWYRAGVARKGSAGVDEVLALDEERRRLLVEVEQLRHRRNVASKAIGEAKRAGRDAAEAVADMRRLADQVAALEARLGKVEAELQDRMARLPNVPHPDVPDGGPEANREIRSWGEPRHDVVRPHWEVGEELGLLDFERAGKVAGTRFAFLRADGARLERALIDLFLDIHTRNGYTELFPPFLVNPDSAFGTAQLPKFGEDMFQTTDGRYLIPTAEVPVTNYHRDEVLKEQDLPVKYCAYSACFRAEAGAAGRDTRGLIRNHQFDKVELVKFAHPYRSYSELESLVADAERVLQALELPYRVVLLAAGDMTFASAMTYDIEVWFPSAGTYREISSCTNFEAYQARRANIRFRDQDGRLQFVHTLNGSGVAVGRTVAAILENYQEPDGRVRIPEVLRGYFRGRTHLSAG